jgi:hypothetical protein
MKKIIAIFGCSWTRGMPDNGMDNWVNYYADMYPDYIFYNMSLSGTSVAFHIHLMNLFKKIHTPYKIIFQLTSSRRFTYFENFDLKDYIVDGQRPNVKILNYKAISDKVHYVVPSMIRDPDAFWIKDILMKRKELQLRNFATDYFTRLNEEIGEIEMIAYSDWIKSNVDFCYSHLSSPSKNVLKIQDILATEQFDRYSLDNYQHFDTEGSIWLANWIDSQIKI